MKYYIDRSSGEVFAYESDGSQDEFIQNGLEPLTDEEFSKIQKTQSETSSPAAERVWRDLEIERIKWLRERHRDEVDMGRTASLTQDQFSQLLVFIQFLRDWPESEGFPKQEKRPVAPSWIEGQVE